MQGQIPGENVAGQYLHGAARKGGKVAGPTMEDVAREAGVSRALVSLVFRGKPHVSEQRRKAVLEAADRLGYRLNATASNLARRETRVLAVVLVDVLNPIIADGAESFQEHAETAGYRVIVGVANRSAQREQAVVETLMQYRPDGLVLLGSRLETSVVSRLARQVPTMLIGRIARDAAIDCIAIDDTRGSALVVEHLVALGHRSIVHIDGGTGAGAAPRRTGYRRAMSRLGLGQHIEVLPGEFSEEAGAKAARLLLDRKELPTAIFAADDMVALGVLEELRSGGVAVPEDVSVVGFDDTTIARLQTIALTTVSQPIKEMTALAVDGVTTRIRTPEAPRIATVVEPHLVERRTTATARP
jgi:DNA-binding LacI/PurR family transcriptional regulator